METTVAYGTKNARHGFCSLPNRNVLLVKLNSAIIPQPRCVPCKNCLWTGEWNQLQSCGPVSFRNSNHLLYFNLIPTDLLLECSRLQMSLRSPRHNLDFQLGWKMLLLSASPSEFPLSTVWYRAVMMAFQVVRCSVPWLALLWGTGRNVPCHSPMGTMCDPSRARVLSHRPLRSYRDLLRNVRCCELIR